MSERTNKIEAIFHAASELSTAEDRERYLDDACSGDEDLRRELDGLLGAAIAGEKLFQSHEQSRRPAGGISVESVAEAPGMVIGRYKLLEKIGEGGMGVVYMAEQEQPVRRKVALKIIKLGMDTRAVVARFEAERQALAMMDHPNIAQVHDAGATDAGRPYFVMELVQGIPITDFCAANGLLIKDRLELFIPVCDAIQSAHQKGIIHRDIKPSNVLVTMHNGAAHPMVIDFGVAKAVDQKLTEKTLFTNFATMIGTPAYMSPEQAEMSKLDVDTRSDIYSLGVLLYELLTGTTPFPEERLRSVAYGEMQRIIVEEEPLRPSTRLRKTALTREVDVSSRSAQSPRPTIDPDLDWIVMKCLEKDRGRRYETANALAADIQRFLADEPVMAHPPGKLYRLERLYRRNKLKFAAASVTLVAVCAGLLVSTWQAVRAIRAERDAIAVKEFLIEQLLAANLFMETAVDPNRQRLLERVAEAAARRFANQPLIEAEVRMAVGEAFHGIDDGDGASLEQFEKALAIRRGVLGPTHPDTLFAIGCAAIAHLQLGQLDDGEKVLTEALPFVLAQHQPGSIGEVEVLQAYGSILLRKGRAQEAISYLDRATTAAERLADHKSWRYQMKLVWQIGGNKEAGRTNEADALSLAGIRQAHERFGTNPVTASFYSARASLLNSTGRSLEAAKLFERDVLPVLRRGFGTNHSRTLRAEFSLARSLELGGELESALSGYSNLYDRVAAKWPFNWAREELRIMGTFFTNQKRFDLARAVFDPLCKSYDANPPANPEEFEIYIKATGTTKGWPAAAELCRKHCDQFADLPSMHRTMGTIFLYVDDNDWYRKVTTQAIALAPATTLWEQQLAILHIAARADFAFSEEQRTQCEALIQSVERASAGAAPPQQARAHRAIGALQLRLGALTNSLAHLEQALQAQEIPTNRGRTLLIKTLCLHRLGRPEEARAAFAQGESILKPLLFDRLDEFEGFLSDSDRGDILLHREARGLLGVK